MYIYIQSWAALLENVAALPLPIHGLNCSGATATATIFQM